MTIRRPARIQVDAGSENLVPFAKQKLDQLVRNVTRWPTWPTKQTIVADNGATIELWAAPERRIKITGGGTPAWHSLRLEEDEEVVELWVVASNDKRARKILTIPVQTFIDPFPPSFGFEPGTNFTESVVNYVMSADERVVAIELRTLIYFSGVPDFAHCLRVYHDGVEISAATSLEIDGVDVTDSFAPELTLAFIFFYGMAMNAEGTRLVIKFHAVTASPVPYTYHGVVDLTLPGINAPEGAPPLLALKMYSSGYLWVRFPVTAFAHTFNGPSFVIDQDARYLLVSGEENPPLADGMAYLFKIDLVELEATIVAQCPFARDHTAESVAQGTTGTEVPITRGRVMWSVAVAPDGHAWAIEYLTNTTGKASFAERDPGILGDGVFTYEVETATQRARVWHDGVVAETFPTVVATPAEDPFTVEEAGVGETTPFPKYALAGSGLPTMLGSGSIAQDGNFMCAGVAQQWGDDGVNTNEGSFPPARIRQYTPAPSALPNLDGVVEGFVMMSRDGRGVVGFEYHPGEGVFAAGSYGVKWAYVDGAAVPVEDRPRASPSTRSTGQGDFRYPFLLTLVGTVSLTAFARSVHGIEVQFKADGKLKLTTFAATTRAAAGWRTRFVLGSASMSNPIGGVTA